MKSRCGFSLIEVIIALALLLGAISIFGLALSSLPLTKTARSQNIAYHIAEKQIEKLRNTSFAALPSSGSFTDPGLADLLNPTTTLAIVNYQNSTQIKQVTVTVGWQDPGGKARSVTLSTLISNSGLGEP